MRVFPKYYSTIKITVAATAFLFLFFSFTLPLNPQQSGWYQQFMPYLGGRSISDITFIDSLTGWAVTPYRFQNDTAYIIKTNNGGNNWNIINIKYSTFVGYNKVKFLNQNTGFVCGAYEIGVYKSISKSTNGGVNWFSLNSPDVSMNDMYVLNTDTIWLVSSESLTGGVFRTTNGGVSWQQQYAGSTSHIYFYNSRIGFMDGGGNLKKTTNSGETWTSIPGEGEFSDMYFADSLTGWYCNQIVKKTTNGDCPGSSRCFLRAVI